MNKIKKYTLKHARESTGLTQEDAAASLHVSVRTLQGYEQHDHAPAEMLERMADLYNAPYLIADRPADAAVLLARAGREMPELINEMLDIAADGKVTADEARRFARVCDRAATINSACMAVMALDAVV